MTIYNFIERIRRKSQQYPADAKQYQYLSYAGVVDANKDDESLDYCDAIFGSSSVCGNAYFGKTLDMDKLQAKLNSFMKKLACSESSHYFDQEPFYFRWDFLEESLLIFYQDDPINYPPPTCANVFRTEFGSCADDEELAHILMDMQEHGDMWKIGRKKFNPQDEAHMQMHREFTTMALRVQAQYAYAMYFATQSNDIKLVELIFSLIEQENKTSALSDRCMAHACEEAYTQGHEEILNYLLYEKHIPLTPHIEDLFEKSPALKLLFEARDGTAGVKLRQ